MTGSGRGRRSVCDVVLIKDGKGYLVEVKYTRDTTFYVSDKPDTKRRLHDLIRVSKQCGATPILAVRFKHRGKRRTWGNQGTNRKTDKSELRRKNAVLDPALRENQLTMEAKRD